MSWVDVDFTKVSPEVDISDVLADLKQRHPAPILSRVNMQKRGSEYVGLCPFVPETSPSFTLYRKAAGWRGKCFGCGWAGDVVDFVMQHDRINFQEALKRIQAELKDLPPEQEQSPVEKQFSVPSSALPGASMTSFADNPFAVLTIVVAPAILTSASSMLCLGTNNQLSRVVDRTRIVSAQLATLSPTDESRPLYQHQLQALEVRWTLVLRSLKLFYMSLGSFAAAALISLLGAMLTGSALHAAFIVIALLALSSGIVGVAGLVIGCAAMVRETRLAIENL